MNTRYHSYRLSMTGYLVEDGLSSELINKKQQWQTHFWPINKKESGFKHFPSRFFFSQNLRLIGRIRQKNNTSDKPQSASETTQFAARLQLDLWTISLCTNWSDVKWQRWCVCFTSRNFSLTINLRQNFPVKLINCSHKGGLFFPKFGCSVFSEWLERVLCKTPSKHKAELQIKIMLWLTLSCIDVTTLELIKRGDTVTHRPHPCVKTLNVLCILIY